MTSASGARRSSDGALVLIVIAAIGVLWYVGVERRDAKSLAAFEAVHRGKREELSAVEERWAQRPPWIEPAIPGDAAQAYARALEAWEPSQMLIAVEEGLRSSRCSAVEAVARPEGAASAQALASALVAKGQVALAEARGVEAAQRFLAAVWLGEDLGRHGGVREQMTGVAASVSGLDALRLALAAGSFGDAPLVEIEAGLAHAAERRRPMSDALSAESVLTTSRLIVVARDADTAPKLRRGLWWHRRGSVIAAMVGAQGHLHALRNAAEHAGHCELAGARAIDEGLVIAYGRKPYFPLLEELQFAPAIVEDAHAVALLRGTRLQAALIRWRLRTGAYPEKLLGPDFGPAWTDPFSADRERCQPVPLTYRRTPPAILSVGPDGAVEGEGSWVTARDDIVFPLPR